jgi:hypothetical protein
MNQLPKNEVFNFNVEFEENMEFKDDWIKDIDNPDRENLIKFYNSDDDMNYDVFRNLYYEYINKCIKANNIIAFEIFCQAISYNDRDCPWYFENFKKAVEYGNLKMVLHCLYSYMNEYNPYNDEIGIKYDELLLSCKNNEVLSFLKSLQPIIVNNILLSIFCENFEEIRSSDDGDNYEEDVKNYKIYKKIISDINLYEEN